MNLQPSKEIKETIIECGKGNENAIHAFLAALMQAYDGTFGKYKRSIIDVPHIPHSDNIDVHFLSIKRRDLLDCRWDIVAAAFMQVEKSIEAFIDQGPYHQIEIRHLVKDNEIMFVCVVIK